MCGLAGYINLSNKKETIEEPLLQKMQQVLAHRGPDGNGIWKSDEHQIGFAHRRLSIIDLSDAGAQPMSNKSKTVTVVFNGEIYNYKTLRTELENLGHTFVTRTDTEVLIHAYEEWGIESIKSTCSMIHRLDGMFAIAIFDATKQELFLIRDRMGIKPLYFSTQSHYLSFASEIKALWQLPWMKRNISQQALYHYLTFMVTPAPYTIFEGVYKLPAGFYAHVKANRQIDFHEWYNPMEQIDPKRRKEFNDEQFCIENIRNLLRESTKKRMISDVPFGAFLSGGIDSSLNVALMAESIKKVKTFTISFSDGPEINELKWARLVAKKFDTDHHEIVISQKEAYDFYESMVYHLDEPLADCVCIPFYYVAKHAKECGVTVAQVGEGSDELFFGYNMYAQYKKLHKYFWQPAQKLPMFAKKLSYQLAHKFCSSRPSVVDTLHKLSNRQSLFWGGAIAFSETQKQAFLHHNKLRPADGHDQIVEKIYPDLKQRCDSHTIVDYHISELKKRHPNASFMQQMAYLELKQRLPELLLMRADKMSMATGVEARVPFLDHKIVEFALQIPDHIKFKNRWIKSTCSKTKYILKKACEGIIPDEIIYRKKLGFAAPIVRWFDSDGPFAQRFRSQQLQVPDQNRSYSSAVQKWVVQNYATIKNPE